jgi:hypothetical protein
MASLSFTVQIIIAIVFAVLLVAFYKYQNPTVSTEPPVSTMDYISKLKDDPKLGKLFIVFTIILMIILLIMLFNHGSLKTKTLSKDTTTLIVSNTFIMIAFIVVAFLMIVSIIPNVKEKSDILKQQMWSVIKVFLYTMAFILFFLSVSKETLDTYAILFVPISIILTIMVFLKGFKSDYVSSFDIKYERVKSLILFVCFLAIIIVYYSVDPGGFISKYFGNSMLLVILMAAFVLLFMILKLSIPNVEPFKGQENASKLKLPGNNKILFWGSILFTIFMLIVSIGCYYYPGGITNDKKAFFGVIVITTIVALTVGTGIITNTYPEFSDAKYTTTTNSKATRALLMVFGVLISSLFIAFIMYNLQHTSAIGFILNLMLVLVVLTLVYKTVYVDVPGEKNNEKKNAFFSFCFNLLMYIPCFLSDVIDFLRKSKDHDNLVSLVLLILAVILSLIYYRSSIMNRVVSLQGGKLLVANPVFTDELHTLATYEELNGTDGFDYQYGLSFWIYLNTFSPSASPSSNQFVSLLNYGNKPNILYRASTNTLMVTMDQKHLTKHNKLIDFDENGNRIIYKQEKVLLQKWNNIVINYYGGTLDVFFNNELVKSAIEVVPYMKLDTLTIGSPEGVMAGICNVQFFSKPIGTTNMYVMYHSVKDYNPPVIAQTNKTLIPITK